MNAKHFLCGTLVLLHIFILLGSCNGAGEEQPHPHIHSHSAMDPSVNIFFFFEDLKIGNMMKIYFPKRKLSDSLPHLLTKEEADSIPFSSHQLPQILRLFSFSDGSPQASAMAATLEECDREPIQGEQKFCATSAQSMSEFLGTIFGGGTAIEALTTAHLKRSEEDSGGQRYGIAGIERIPSPKMVSCHTMPYAYTVFYCHYHESENRVYRVMLEGENGDEVGAIAVCHMDTSQWGRGHVAFGILGVEPGSTPVCHFFPADNFVWVPTVTSLQV